MITQRFIAFFEAVNDGASPYPWQVALMEEIARTGRWPREITAPTGAGKSSIVDIHTFVVAERARQVASGEEPDIARPPRRLVLVAPRRVLVDDQYERALRLAAALTEENREESVAEVAEALHRLVTSREELEEETGKSVSPLGVAKLRGGITLDLSWRLDPSRCQIICTTPQMWGSRLLLRGYRGTKRARALEAGLLTNDVAVVIDEAHLHQRLVSTARRVASFGTGEMGLQVTAMSATIGGGRTLGPEDYADPSLARRVEATKSIERVEIHPWRESAAAEAIAEQAVALQQGATVGVFVNTVERALEVAGRLEATGGEVVVVCGRMRPADIEAIKEQYEGLLDARGNPEVDYLVSTQSLEVGADLDLAAMVSELAPPSALAQRAGRLNRSGSWSDARFVVVGPPSSSLDPEAAGHKLAPYDERDLHAGASWLDSLNGPISPRRVAQSGIPPSDPPPLPILAATDLETIAITSSELSADVDVDLYIEEPRDEPEREVSVCARNHLGFGDASLAALKAAPPTARELAPFRIGRPLFQLREKLSDEPVAILRTRNGETEAFWWQGDGDERKPADGDVIVIPAGKQLMTARVIDPVTKANRGKKEIDDVSAKPEEDGAQSFVFPLTSKEVAESLAADANLSTRRSRELLSRTLAGLANTEAIEASKILKGRLRDIEVFWFPEEAESDANERGLLVIRKVGSGRLPTTAPAGLVTLAAHHQAVESRLGEIHETLEPHGLGVEPEQLLMAARHHDSGKTHPLFQARMGAGNDDEPLAKPKPGHRPDRGDGWRHEQLSAAFAAEASGFDPVVVVTAAEHHGNGQPLFDRDASALLGAWEECPPAVREAAERLFGPGGEYEALREQVIERLGIHRLAYVEALLRCADMQVSREGR